MRNNNVETALPWFCILVIIVICILKATDSRICIVGSSGLNRRYKELFENDTRVINKLNSFLQRDTLHGCHGVFILETPNSDFGDFKDLARIRNTEYFMFLIELYDMKHLFRGIIPNQMNREEMQDLLLQF